MNDLKNINTASDFEKRTGLIVWLHSKKNIRRLMNFGVLHYVSKKMNYAILYVPTEKVEKIVGRLTKENYVKSVEVSQLRDLPIHYEDVLENIKQDHENKKRQERFDQSEEDHPLDYKKW